MATSNQYAYQDRELTELRDIDARWAESAQQALRNFPKGSKDWHALKDEIDLRLRRVRAFDVVLEQHEMESA